ncbi:MAG TPA: DUF3102 domain-containing protein [Microvirga sp.]|jgi:hypothetical protein
MSSSLKINTKEAESAIGAVTVAAVPLQAAVFDYNVLPDKLAAGLRQTAERIQQKVTSTVLGLVEIGRDLYAAKKQLEHGQFVSWLEAEVRIHPRSAQRYIGLALFAEGKNDMMSFLTPNAAYKLAAKSTPPEVVEAVRQTIEAGGLVTECGVDRLLNEYKRARKQQCESAEPPTQDVQLASSATNPSSETPATANMEAAAKAHLLLKELGPERVRIVVEALRTDASTILMQLEAALVSNTATERPTISLGVAPVRSRSALSDIPACLDRRTGSKGAAV